ncbi:MAG TPA: signal peptidase I [Acidimicrobiales bacterium]|nr:signal peptidase I [Acidimicrobiales bacterium]
MALLLIVGGWFAYLRPPALGGGTEYVFVRGDSMLPTFRPGDLVVTRAKKAYDVGDVVAFAVEGHQARIIHRVTAVADGRYVLQGDNRDAADPWHPTDDDVTGVQLLHVPRLGAALIRIAQTPLLLALLASFIAFATVALSQDADSQPSSISANRFRPPRPRDT